MKAYTKGSKETLGHGSETMALQQIVRHWMPVDGTWVRTEARLDGILLGEIGYDESLPSESIRDSWVPIWVCMEL
jgi:hypothetical protein